MGEQGESKGFFRRLFDGLAKTRNSIVSGIDAVFGGYSSIDEDFYEEIEEILIMGDLGVHATEEILDDLRRKVKEQGIKKPEECKALLIESIRDQMDVGTNDYAFENQKSVILVIGVNGVGKTTSIGKLASKYKKQGKKVLLAAADTFRAAAGEQLEEWAKRAGVDIISGQEGSDPGAVVYDAINAAKARDVDILLVDTAGRLHNKKNLMNELGKINRIIDSEYPQACRETFVVLDATTGQNALSQAKQFGEATQITGIILTKMDGSAKGGIAVAIHSELGIPVKYIGVGEKVEDLQRFNSNAFVNALFDIEPDPSEEITDWPDLSGSADEAETSDEPELYDEETSDESQMFDEEASDESQMFAEEAFSDEEEPSAEPSDEEVLSGESEFSYDSSPSDPQHLPDAAGFEPLSDEEGNAGPAGDSAETDQDESAVEAKPEEELFHFHWDSEEEETVPAEEEKPKKRGFFGLFR